MFLVYLNKVVYFLIHIRNYSMSLKTNCISLICMYMTSKKKIMYSI